MDDFKDKFDYVYNRIKSDVCDAVHRFFRAFIYGILTVVCCAAIYYIIRSIFDLLAF